MPQLSAEVFVIPLDGERYIVYAPLRRAAFVGNAATVNFLAELREQRFDDAADAAGSLTELLRRLEIVDGGEETPPLTTFRGDPMPTAVTLFLTTACNLRCTYCYASAGDRPLRSMTIDVARRGIDFVVANAVRKEVKEIEIAYHGGGEPTVNWRVMIESLEYARRAAGEHGLAVRATAATNGVLSDGQVEWMIANLDGVSLSIDGPPEVNDRNRPTVRGEGSTGKVMRTLARFDEAEFPYGLRVTVTQADIAALPETIEFLCARFRPQRIQVEPAYQLGRWTEAPTAETEEFIAAFRQAQRRAHAHGRTIGYSAARLGTLTNHFCGVTQDTFALSPDGNVSACYEVFAEDLPWSDVFFYGKPEEDGGYVFDRKVLDNLRRQSVEHREFCRGCFAKWSCAGDCYHKALYAGDGEFRGSARCHITRELTKDQILERIAASGGWFWHEGAP